jgi:hypothetical protein
MDAKVGACLKNNSQKGYILKRITVLESGASGSKKKHKRVLMFEFSHEFKRKNKVNAFLAIHLYLTYSHNELICDKACVINLNA